MTGDSSRPLKRPAIFGATSRPLQWAAKLKGSGLI
jgi:hypothetical protein